jgi:hypothetical protein
MSELWLPKHLRKERVAQQGNLRQLSKAIIYWYNRKRDYIVVGAPEPIKAPSGYETIRCIHAHEADKWSERLRAQERRLAQMTDEERLAFEDAVAAENIAEARKNLARMPDSFNKQIAALIVERMEASRAKHAKPSVVEGVMAFEKEECVAP